MSDLLAKDGMPGWGEDLHGFLEKCRKEGNQELVRKVEEKLTAGYLMALRGAFESDPEIRRVVESSQPATEAAPFVADRLWGFAKPGSEDIFEKAVWTILEELDFHRSKPPSLYLVNPTTGKAVVPLTEGSIFQPPDFVGEDGRTHKARPIVHPSITSALALSQQDAARQESLAKRADSGFKRHALAHGDLDGIAESVRQRLESAGVQRVDSLPDADPAEVEFGREQVDGLLQSPNFGFHRISVFSAVLAVKVLRLCGPGGTYSMGPIQERKGSKQKWYMVTVRVRQSPWLPP